MKIVFFGLSISSAWGNGHATLLRGLFRALYEMGHKVQFFEKDVPYYAAHRDSVDFPFVKLHLYREWQEVVSLAASELRDADVGAVTSYCADGAAACGLVLGSRVNRSVFYDMDTPVTLRKLDDGQSVPYLPRQGLGEFDLVLSYTGGQALRQLHERLAAVCVSPLYGWVDARTYYPAEAVPQFAGKLSYLGTYSADRQRALDELMLEPSARLPKEQFVIGGAMYPNTRSWPQNVRHFEHVSPRDHTAFYSSSPLTLNVTRGSMAAMGYCPSGRLFEASACGTGLLSDWWEGLDTFFEPGREILIATESEEAIQAIRMDANALRGIGARARARTLDCHRVELRAAEFISLVENPWSAEITPDPVSSGRGA